MIKKLLLVAILSLPLAPITAQEVADNPDQATEQVVAEEPDGQAMLESDTPDATAINQVEESAITGQMTQAEKARNAAENDSWGGAITIIAMCIVIGALIVLCLLFFGFGKISSGFMAKKKRESYGLSKQEAAQKEEKVDSGEAIAAIAAALAQHFDTDGHDLEDTILTIHRIKKSYSPWNSKIYNMRELPEVRRNVRPMAKARKA